MRIAARKHSNDNVPRRERLKIEHLRAPAVSQCFPGVQQLRIELVFSDPEASAPPPSPQLHTLFIAAPAFFRFSCPCADCDGEFDLTDAVTTLVAGLERRKQRASGQQACHGVRFRGHGGHQVDCSMQLTFQLLAEPRRAA